MVYRPLILKNIQNFNEESLHYIMGKSPYKPNAGGPLIVICKSL